MKKESRKIKTLLYFLKGCKKYFVLAVLFVWLQVLFDLINPKIIGYTVDFIIGDESQIPGLLMGLIQAMGGREYVLGHLYLVALIVVLVGLGAATARYLFKLFDSMGAERLAYRMRSLLYEHIVHLPFSWHDSNSTGDIIQRCTSDVDVIKSFISDQLVNLMRMVVMIIFALYFMFQIHILLALAAFIFVPIVILYSLLFHGRIEESFLKVDTEEGQLSAIAQENLSGVRVVRAFGREQYERARFEAKNETYIGHWVDMMKILSKFWTITDFVRGIDNITVMALGAYFTVQGQLTPGQYVTFIAYNAMIVQPIVELGRVISEMSKSGVSVDRLSYILDSKIEEDSADAVDFPGNGDIVFEGVSFAYEGAQVLSDVNIRIGKGQTVGILGPTGSGKSTLMLLLDNLYQLSEGTITINGVDVTKIKRSQLRQHIGMVLQEPYLFSRSLQDNITIAAEEASSQDMQGAIATASLTSAIGRFKEGLNTYVGERGVTLSGGQKQRTAIAQMLIRQPDIMIFDDSLSAVDAATDASIRAALAGAKGDATVIIISHRITTIMKADNIFVLENGQVAESGNHDTLMAQGGIYRTIFDMQAAASEEE